MTDRPDYAAWADESTQHPDGTFFVAVCQADRPGFWTLNTGWKDLASAKQEAARANGIWGRSEDAALAIRASSMAEHNVGWRASDDALLHGNDPDTDQS